MKSEELWKKAIKLIPAGTQCYSHGVTQFVGGSPKFLERGNGCYVWDVDGNKYLDFSSGGFPTILGYGYKPVTDAVCKQLKQGTLFPMPHPLEVEVSELLTQTIPSAEMVRFGKNGSDVCGMAVRVARAFTGRDLIVSQGYHGTQDWYICTTERNVGIPNSTKDHIITFKYNDIDTFKKIFEEYGEQIAAVILEPVQLKPPKNDFLKKIRAITKKHGALLIFDEIITGFRFDMGGAQQFFNIKPDLSCFGKAMANGMPLSAFVGRSDVMQCFNFENKAFFSSTFGGETASLAAAKKTIEELQDKKVIPFIWEQGKRLGQEFNELVNDNELNKYMECVGYPIWTDINFPTLEHKSLFQQEAMSRGLLAELTHAISFANTDKYIEEGLNIYNRAMKSFKLNIEKVEYGTDINKLIKGNVIKPVFKRLE